MTFERKVPDISVISFSFTFFFVLFMLVFVSLKKSECVHHFEFQQPGRIENSKNNNFISTKFSQQNLEEKILKKELENFMNEF